MQKSLKWTAAQPQRKQDNIISSKARESGDLTGFVPSYLSEPTEDMKCIMSNEYMRKWYKERGSYEKNTYSKLQIIKEESKIKRRFVQRMMTYKKPNKFGLLEENLNKSKTQEDSMTITTDYSKLKYKPYCQKSSKDKKLSDNNAEKKIMKTNKKINKDEDKNKLKEKVANNNNQTVIAINVCAPCCPN